VAVKILPDVLALDPDRTARFEREAKVVASVNHPHIAALYGFEETADRRFLVMELVEGETLSDRLRRGAMPLGEALTVAHQIADALESAHDKGIVHRDLKPANVKITPDDRVKVLDFGLARLQGEPGAASRGSLTNSPTLSLVATQAGVVLGTAAYMSPEQAKGLVADHRSDVFSFGSVLYEMLTGRQAFQAETPAETMAVLMREPDFGALSADLNPRIPDLLRRCLDKQPKRRWQAAGDLRAEIETIRAAPKALPALVTPALAAKPAWRRAIQFAVTGIVSALVAGGLVGLTVKRPAPPVVVRFPIFLGEGVQFSSAAFRSLDISPDGTRVVYSADARLYERALSEPEPRPIPGTEQNVAGDPTFSPDGQSIAFVQQSDRTLRKIATRGGAAITLTPIEAPFSLSWDRDAILFSQPSGIMRVPSAGGQPPERIVSLKSGERAFWPQMLPDGETLLFSLTTGMGQNLGENLEVVAQSIKSGARRTIVPGGNAARYLPSGYLVYAVGGVLLAAPFDPARAEMTGAPTPVVEGVGRGQSGTPQFSVSNNGSLVYLPGPASTGLLQTAMNVAVLDEKGKVDILKLPAGPYESPRISPDGKRIVFASDDGREATISVYGLDGASAPRRLTFEGEGKNRYPIWSADGKRVAFQSDRHGDLAIFWQPADGSCCAERLTKPETDEAHIPESWSRRDDLFSFSVVKSTSATLSTYSVADRKATPFSNVRSATMLNSDFSPDGQWIAYTVRGGTSITTIYVEPFPATGAKQQISTPKDLGHHPAWSPNGRTLFYIPGALPLTAVSITTRPEFSAGNHQVWPGRLPNNNPYGGPRNFDVAPDGTRFVFTTAEPGQAAAVIQPARIQVVVNWSEELKQRVPTR
jgi:serine/threonine-protein kinase